MFCNICNLTETLECPICLNICFKEPIYQCPEGHLLCEECNLRLLNCPTCEHALLNARNRTAEDLAEKLRVLIGEKEILNNIQTRDGFLTTVVEPLKIGKGLAAAIVFKINTRSINGRNRFSVSRKYKDIIKLHRKLYQDHHKDGIIIPPPPASKILDFSSLWIKFSSIEEVKEGSEYSASVSNKTQALDRYIKRLAKHHLLRKDPVFRAFIQETELSKVLSEIRKPTFRQKISNMFNFSVNSEKDPWFQTRINRLEELSKRIKSFKVDLNEMAELKSKLLKKSNAFQQEIILLNVSSTNRFSLALTKAVESHRKSGSIYKNQVEADMAIISLLDDYIIMINSALRTISLRRQKQDEIKNLKKRKKLEEEDIVSAQSELDKLSINIRKELEHFEIVMSQEFEDQFTSYNNSYHETLHSEKSNFTFPPGNM